MQVDKIYAPVRKLLQTRGLARGFGVDAASLQLICPNATDDELTALKTAIRQRLGLDGYTAVESGD